MALLILEDKLGITAGYKSTWEALCFKVGLSPSDFQHYSVWRSPLVHEFKLLDKKGNRKSPGFNEDPMAQAAIDNWIRYTIQHTRAEAILCMDFAVLGLIESSWDIATIDRLRGGVYRFASIPFVVTVPISAIHQKKSAKDIRAMNQGREHEDEIEDDDDDDVNHMWMEPYTIPFGRWILNADLKKFVRIISKERADNAIR